MNEKNLHWYVFCFFDGKKVNDIVSGWPEKNLTISRMNEAKQTANMSKESKLINCTYLGYMTEEDQKE